MSQPPDGISIGSAVFRHQDLHTWLRCGHLPSWKIFIQIVVVSAHAWFRASNCLLGYFLGWGVGVLQIVYTQDVRADFDAKYVNRRGFAQGFAFLGSQNHMMSSTKPEIHNAWQEEDRATAIGNMHKNGKNRTCGSGDILAHRQTDTDTHTHIRDHRNTLQPLLWAK